MRKALRATLFAAAFLLPGGAIAQVGSETGSDRIVAAREALRKGDRDTLERLAAVTREALEAPDVVRVTAGTKTYAQGDTVEITESRPLSKTKNWVATRLVQKAAQV